LPDQVAAEIDPPVGGAGARDRAEGANAAIAVSDLGRAPHESLNSRRQRHRGTGLASRGAKGGIAERPCVGDVHAVEPDGLAANPERRVILDDRIALDVGRCGDALSQNDA
jgi:hypothetical protein